MIQLAKKRPSFHGHLHFEALIDQTESGKPNETEGTYSIWYRTDNYMYCHIFSPRLLIRLKLNVRIAYTGRLVVNLWYNNTFYAFSWRRFRFHVLWSS